MTGPDAGAPGGDPSSLRRFAALGVFAAALALYARTTDYGFLDWDDGSLVVENPWIRAFSLENLVAILTQPLLDSFFPLQSVSYAVDHALWGMDPFGFHLHSVLLNAINAVLAFALLWRLGGRPVVAFLGALLWAVHPSHVSSVAWVSARKELLFGCFAMLSTLAWLRARRDAALHRPAYALSLLCFALGAAAKAPIAVFPLFFWLADHVESAQRPETRRPLGARLALLAPYLLLALPFLWMNFRVQIVADTVSLDAPLEYVLVRGHAVWRYLWILLGLLPGQPMYDLPPLRGDPLSVVAILAPFALVPALIAVALRRGWREPALALGWLAVGLIPPLAFPLTTYMADRYLYVPSLGFCWLLAQGIAALAGLARGSPVWRHVALVAFTAAFALPFVRTAWAYTPVWRDSESLWSYAVAHSRDGRAATSLSAALIREGRLDEAESVLRTAPALGANGHLHLAIVHMKRDEVEAALAETEEALRLTGIQTPRPQDLAKLLWLRGVALGRLGRGDEAVAAWEEAVRADPANREARELLDLAREALGEAKDP